MPTKHFYAFKKKSEYSEKDLKTYYAINPQGFQPTRTKDGEVYVGIEFAEKAVPSDETTDDRNVDRLKELVAGGWHICETPAKAHEFLANTAEETEPDNYVPTDKELGIE